MNFLTSPRRTTPHTDTESTMNANAIQQVAADAADINNQIKARHDKRESLHAQLAQIQATRSATVSVIDQARADLTDAYSRDNADAITEARKRVASASEGAATSAGLEIEAQALQSAIASIDAECSALCLRLSECADREKAIRLARVREMASDLSIRQQKAAQAIAAVAADAAALSMLARQAGAGGAEFGPINLMPFDIQHVGPGFVDRGRFAVDPGAMIQQRLDANMASLSREGFWV